MIFDRKTTSIILAPTKKKSISVSSNFYCYLCYPLKGVRCARCQLVMAVNLRKLSSNFSLTDGNREVSVIRFFIDKKDLEENSYRSKVAILGESFIILFYILVDPLKNVYSNV